MDSALKILEKLVVDDGKCVTKTSLLRKTSLSMREIENVMSEFYKTHKNLSAMFLAYGMKKSEDGASVVRQSILCNQDQLEEAKSGFERVISTTIYSLHQNPTTTVQALLNADWSGKYENPSTPYEDRLNIVSPLALQAIKSWKKRNPKEVHSEYEIPEFVPRVKKGPKALAKSIIVKNDQQSLKDAFAVAVKNTEVAEKMELDDDLPNSNEPVKRIPHLDEDDSEKPVIKKKAPEPKLARGQQGIGSFFKKV